MLGLGTIVNSAAIIVGGIIGMLFKKLISPGMQESVTRATGVCVLFIGIGGALSQMLRISENGIDTAGTLMIVLSVVLGTVVGELIRIDDGIEKFGSWLKKKTGSEKDHSFLDGFVSATCTVCIGAMAIVGAIEDGISGDHATLFAKSILDFVIVLVMASSMGKGCIFSAIPVFLLQGSFTLLAKVISPLITDGASSNISLVGSVLIFCVGLNLVWGKRIKVANMLPALLFAAGAAFLPFEL